MAYKAIGFDYGGVIKGKPGTVFTQSICELLGVDIDTYRAAYFAHNKDVNRGDIDWPELWRRVLADLNKPGYLDEVLKINEERDSNLPEQINQEVLQLVKRLKNRGYKTGLLSNNTLKAGKEIRQLGIDHYFDVFHISAETRLVKPEPEAFRYFAECLGVDMKELVFIDDARKSLSTSDECGFTPILYTDFQSLQKSLSDLRVL